MVSSTLTNGTHGVSDVPDAASTGRMMPDSWLDLLARDVPLSDASGPLTSTVAFRGVQAVPVFLDHGNAQFKFALPNTGRQRRTNGPRLVIGAVSTVTQPAEQLRSSQGIRTWRVADAPDADWSAPFWFGTSDVRTVSHALSIGSTAERLHLPHHRHVVYAMLVHALREAGHQPGTHHLLLGFGVPVEEITASGPTDATREVLREAFKQRTVRVALDDPQHGTQQWTLTIASHASPPQSLGSYTAWSHDLWGNRLPTEFDQVTVIDIGGGHTQHVKVTINHGAPTMSGSLLGEGTVQIARALRSALRGQQRYAKLDLSHAAYQQALVSRRVRRAGRQEDIGALVDATIREQGAHLLERTVDDWQDPHAFLMFTGGGSVLLRGLLTEMAATYGRTPDEYLLVPDALAPTANAVGGFVQLMMLAARG